MADISKITLPNGNTYNIKDAEARAAIDAFAGGNAVVFMGVSTVALTDGGNENPTVNGNEITTKTKGQLYFYGTKEYVYGADNKWHELGSLEGLGGLAYKSNASASYTPAGTVSQPTFTGTKVQLAGTTTAAGAVSQPTFSNGSISGSGTTTPAGVVSQPTFEGTGVRLVTGNIAVPTSASFTGTEATINVSGTATGTVSKPTFTGTKASGLTVSAASSGTATYTPAGSVAAPTISIAAAGATDNTLKPVTAKSVANSLSSTAPTPTQPTNAIVY